MPTESRPDSPLESRADSKLVSSDRIRGRRGSYPVPANSLAASNPRGHTRAASSNNILSTGPISPKSGVVRKPAPRAQLPVSVAHSTASNDNTPDAETHADELRMELQSSVGSAVDMTGVGTHKYGLAGEPQETIHQRMPSRFYGNLHFPPGTPASVVKVPQNGGPSGSTQPFGGPAGRLDAQPTSRDANPTPNPSRSRPSHRKTSSQSGVPTTPLLGPGAFRDSDNSSNSNQTVEVPIAWTGVGKENGHSGGQSHSRDRKENGLPGGWASSSTGVKESRASGDHPNPNESHRHKHSMTPLPRPEEQEVKAGTPELVYPKVRARSGRATLVTETSRAETTHGVKAPDRHPVPAPVYPTPAKRDHNPAKPAEGWVLVNVGHPSMSSTPPYATSPPPQHSLQRKQSFPPMSQQRPPPSHSPYSTGSRAAPTDPPVGSYKKGHSNYNPSSMSPAAKAIVVFDAIEAKRKATNGDPPQSSFRKFFSLSRPDSPGKSPDKLRKLALTGGGSKCKLLEQEDGANQREGAARERLRTRGMPEGRKGNRRMSVD